MPLPATGNGSIMFADHPFLSVCLLTPMSCNVIGLCSVERFQRNFHIYSPCELALLKRFSGSEVKSQGHDLTS